jgi:hypothetical protein
VQGSDHPLNALRQKPRTLQRLWLFLRVHEWVLWLSQGSGWACTGQPYNGHRWFPAFQQTNKKAAPLWAEQLLMDEALRRPRSVH